MNGKALPGAIRRQLVTCSRLCAPDTPAIVAATLKRAVRHRNRAAFQQTDDQRQTGNTLEKLP